MEAKSQVEALEADIRAIIDRLLELEVTPHIRELRAKAVTYGRVIGSWSIYPPTPPQLEAMIECVNELQTKVSGSQRPAARAPSKHAPMKTLASHRAGAGSMGPGVSKSGAPPIDGHPFAAAPNDGEPEITGVRTRGMRPPAPTIPSDPPLHMPIPDAKGDHGPSIRPRRGASVAPSTAPSRSPTVVPASRKRPASDTKPTPVPALLQTRRSR